MPSSTKRKKKEKRAKYLHIRNVSWMSGKNQFYEKEIFVCLHT
jgi:hypothetical protein